ncbi:alpha/beta fold hydrolase [Deinococcus radiophilus]|uniref:alpha/beta fold hydrolase n=1 Tax=Deinococcus radiophilus TaxID=32062 RepID=UPI003606CE53
MQSPYLRDFVTYDPRPALRRNQVPTLALFGERDLQVPRAAGYLLMQKLLETQPGNLIRELPGLNHLLQPARSGLPSEYAQQSVTLDPAALHQISGWLNTALKR